MVPTSLQMGWMESPLYFCAASETGRDVAARYAEAPIGTLKDHKFRKLTKVMPEFGSLPATAPDDRPNATKAEGAMPERMERVVFGPPKPPEQQETKPPLRYLMEVFVDDYIALAIP